MDGLEAFRVNWLRREADSEISDERVRLFESDPRTGPSVAERLEGQQAIPVKPQLGGVLTGRAWRGFRRVSQSPPLAVRKPPVACGYRAVDKSI